MPFTLVPLDFVCFTDCLATYLVCLLNCDQMTVVIGSRHGRDYKRNSKYTCKIWKYDNQHSSMSTYSHQHRLVMLSYQIIHPLTQLEMSPTFLDMLAQHDGVAPILARWVYVANTTLKMVVAVCVGLSRHIPNFRKCVCRNILWYGSTYAQKLSPQHALNAHFMVLLLSPRSFFIRLTLERRC